MGIKHTPEDFLVEERLSPDLAVSQKSGPFALYRLTKETLDTPMALRMIARSLRVEPDDILSAGLKDKHARTIQHISVRLSDRLKRSSPETASGENWVIERIGFLHQPLDSAAIAANVFTITVRDMTAREISAMNRIAKVLTPPLSPGERVAPTQQGSGPGEGGASNPKKSGAGEEALERRRVSPHPSPLPEGEGVGPSGSRLRFVNYFGSQRFGTMRHGQGFLALNLIRGDFEGALKLVIAAPSRKDPKSAKEMKGFIEAKWGQWKELLEVIERHHFRACIEILAKNHGDFRGAFCALPYFTQQINVQAYQSWLWNRIAYRLIEETFAGQNVLEVQDTYSPLLFPQAKAIPPKLVEMNLPLLARSTVLAEPWKKAAQEVLAEEKISQQELRIPGVQKPFFGESPRRLFVDAAEVSLGEPIPSSDPSSRDTLFDRELSFALPRGAYATVVLRALGL